MDFGSQKQSPIYQVSTKRVEEKEIHINDSYLDSLDEVVKAVINDAPFGESTRLNAVLFKGLPGTGKTYTALRMRTIISDILGNEVPMLQVGSLQSPEDVTSLYQEARKIANEKGRCIIFDDEVDKYGKRNEITDPQKAAILNQILMELNGTESNRGVITICATNRPNAIDPAFRRGKRCGKEIYFDPLDKKGREHISHIEAYNKDHQFIYNEKDLELIVDKTYGSVGADISQLFVDATTYTNLLLYRSLSKIAEEVIFGTKIEKKKIVEMCKELPLENLTIKYDAFVQTLMDNKEKWMKDLPFKKEDEEKGKNDPEKKREIDEAIYKQKVCDHIAYKALELLNPNQASENAQLSEAPKKPTRWIKVETSAIEHVLEHFVPSALKDMPFEETKLKFNSFGGLQKQTDYLKRIVENTILQDKEGTTIFLHGNQGMGVTSLAKSIAGEYGFNLIVIYGADQENQFVGVVKDRLLEINDRAKASKPTIVLFDNIKYLAMNESSIGDQSYKQAATSALKQIIKPTKGVIYMATGESIDELSPSIRTLFHRTIEVTKPTAKDDYQRIWHYHMDTNLSGEQIDLEKLASKSNALAGGEIYRICRFFSELGVPYTQEKLEKVVGYYTMQIEAMQGQRKAVAVNDVELSAILLK